jgi:flagellar motor switch protein FliM
MSDQALSQDEVDALLRGVTGELPEEVAEVDDDSGVRPYDIGRQERIVRGRMPGLELVNERAARHIRLGFYNFMRRSAEISVGPVRIEKYSEFIRKLVVPTNINLISMQPELYGTALYIFDPNLVFQVVDTLFGGTGKIHMRVEGREFTVTEQRVISRMLDIVFKAFDHAWEPIVKLQHKFLRSEMNTQFVNIATPTEVVVVTTFNIELGNGGGNFHVCMPYSMIEPIREPLCSSMQGDRVAADERWLNLMRDQMQDAEVEIKANFCTFETTFRQLLALKVGDMIPVEAPERVTGTIDGVPFLVGQVGNSRGRYAVRIEEMLRQHDKD